MATFNPVGSSPPNASYKVPSNSKDALKDIAQPKETKKIEVKEITVASGFVAPEGTEDATSFTADYYRNGGPIEGDQNNIGNSRSILPFGIDKDYNGDRVASSIRLRGLDSKKKKVIDYIPAYTKFILDAVQESYAERSQIIETFGDHYVFLFGARPSIFQFSGTLINSVNVNWLQDFMFYYENYFRGTKTVDLKAKIILTYGGRQVEGIILNTSNQTNAITEEGVPFSFSMVILQRNFLGFSADFGIVRGPGGTLIADKNLRKLVNDMAGVEGAGTSEVKTSEDQKALKDILAGEQAPANFSPAK